MEESCGEDAKDHFNEKNNDDYIFQVYHPLSQLAVWVNIGVVYDQKEHSKENEEVDEVFEPCIEGPE